MLKVKLIHNVLLKLSLTLLVCLFSVLSFSQDDPTLRFEGTIKDGKGKNLAGVTIKIFQDGKEVYSSTTSSNGKFKSYTADYGYKYKVIIIKDNYVKNTFEINAKDGYHEDDVDENMGVFFDYDLIKKKEDVDYSPLENKPRDKFKFDVVNANIDIDKAYESKRKGEIAAFYKKLADIEKNKEKKFKELVKSGNAAMSRKDWENAIKNWKEALEIKEDEVLAEKLVNAEYKYDEELEEKKLIVKMNRFIKEGDEAVSLLKFENAREKYEIAASIYPKSKLPQKKLKELEKKIVEASQDKSKKAFDELMALADIKIKSESFEEAKKLLADAQKLLPKEKSPKIKLKEIEKIIKNKSENKNKYDKLISEADALFSSKTYDKATGKYKSATLLLPKEQHPKDRIKEIEKLAKAEKVAKDKKSKFNEIVKKADKLFIDKKLEDSKKEYNSALALFPDEKHIKERIISIDKLLAENKKVEEAKEKLKAEYKTLITLADKQFGDKKYVESISNYEKALGIKKREKYPTDQIIKAKKLIKEAEELAIKEAKEKEEKEKLDKEYKTLITSADKQFGEKEYEKAISEYEKALKLKKDEKHPTDQIVNAKKFIKEAKDLAKKQADEIAAKEKLESDYQKLIGDGDKAYTSKKYAKSTSLYEEALKKKPGDSYTTSQIEKIKDILTAEKEKLEEEARLVEKAKADSLQNAKELAQAESDRIAKEKLEEEARLVEKDREDLAKAKAVLEADYKRLIEQGGKEFVSKKYTESINSYESALRLKSEKYPLTQIAKIQELLKAEKQKQLDLASQLEKDKREKARLEQAKVDRAKLAALELERKNKKANIEQQYTKAIELGNKFFTQNKYESSKNKYLEALTIKQDQYPKNQIEKIDRIVQKLAQSNTLKKGYIDAITRADIAYKAEEYEKAIKFYESARQLNPTPSYPSKQIEKIEETLAELEQNKKQEKDRIASIERNYNKYIIEGDKNFGTENYRSSKKSYQKALTFKTNAYPKNRIKEIDEILKELSKSKNGTLTADDYFNMDSDLYGEEVDMSTSDGSILLTNIEDNSAWREYMTLKTYIDSSNLVQAEKTTKHVRFTQFTYKQYEQLKEKIAKKNGVNDYGRYGTITSLGLFANAWSEFQKEEKEKETKTNLATSNYYDKLMDDYVEQVFNTQESKKGLGEEYDKYTAKNLAVHKELSNKQGKTNTSVYEDLEEYKQNIQEEFVIATVKAKGNDEDYEKFKDLVVENNIKLLEQEKNSRDNEIDYLENTQEILLEKSKKGQEKINGFNKEYVEYEESLNNIKKELVKKSNSGNELTNQELEKFKDKKVEESKNKQSKADENSENYNELNDKLFAQGKELADKENLSRKEEEDYLESTNEIILEKSKKRVESIKNHEEEYEKFKDKVSDINSGKAEKSTKKLLKNSGYYTEMEENKTQKSEAIINKLASIFPEGVTQKVYEKKNNFGEITSITVRRIVVKGNKGNDYLHRKTKAGSFYFKNGKTISEGTWDIETSGEIVN